MKKKAIKRLSFILTLSVIFSLFSLFGLKISAVTGQVYAKWNGAQGTSYVTGNTIEGGNVRMVPAGASAQSALFSSPVYTVATAGTYKLTYVLQVDKSTLIGPETNKIVRFTPSIGGSQIYPKDIKVSEFTGSNVWQVFSVNITISANNTTFQPRLWFFGNATLRIKDIYLTSTDYVIPDPNVVLPRIYAKWNGAQGTSYVTGNTIEGGNVRMVPAGASAQSALYSSPVYTVAAAGTYKLTYVLQVDKSTLIGPETNNIVRFTPSIGGSQIYPKDIKVSEFTSSNVWQVFSVNITISADNTTFQPRLWFFGNATLRIRDIYLTSADYVLSDPSYETLKAKIENVTGATARKYGAKDNLNNQMHCATIIQNPEISNQFIAVYHTITSEDATVRLATSTDLMNWTCITALGGGTGDNRTSQATLKKANDTLIQTEKKMEEFLKQVGKMRDNYSKMLEMAEEKMNSYTIKMIIYMIIATIFSVTSSVLAIIFLK